MEALINKTIDGHESENPDNVSHLLLSSVLQEMKSAVPANRNIDDDFDISDINLSDLNSALIDLGKRHEADVTQVMSLPTFFD